MSSRTQTFVATFLVLVAIIITVLEHGEKGTGTILAEQLVAQNSAVGAVSAVNQKRDEKNVPKRKWDILDPKVYAEAVSIQSLDSNFPFFNYQTYKVWPIASLTKLLTAVVVAEEIGMKKKISISQSAIDTEGTAGDFKSGEVYSAEDLIKIMLLTSSNDAATAFEEYGGGREQFIHLMNNKAEKLGMTQTIMHDASGLSDLNQSSASDLIRLARYLVERHPDIISWTRLQNFLVQPVNSPEVHTISNINPLVVEKDYLGGKTGTSPEARENLLAFFSFGNERVAFIILGSNNRREESKSLLNWIASAYIFN
ncbi:MAG: serine hydrolase [Candidatus Paceibacterota bacterium]|jgi:D-alanyl-D-alanine carboxypeptidase